MVLEDARDLLRWDRMRRVERPRLLERGEGVEGCVQARVLDLRERELERDLFLGVRCKVDPRRQRLGRELPPTGVLFEARFERSGARVPRVASEDIAYELAGSRGVDGRELPRGARVERELAWPRGSDASLLEERSRQRARVARPRRGALEAEDRAQAVAVDLEDALVRPRCARRIAEDLLPQERHLFEVRRLAAGVVRPVGGLRVDLDERTRLRVARLREDRRQLERERVEDVGVAWRHHPCGAKMANRVGRASELAADPRGAQERASAVPFAFSVRAASCSQVAMRWSCFPVTDRRRSSASMSVRSVASISSARFTYPTAASRSPASSAAAASARSSYAIEAGSVTSARRAFRARAASAHSASCSAWRTSSSRTRRSMLATVGARAAAR